MALKPLTSQIEKEREGRESVVKRDKREIGCLCEIDIEMTEKQD